MTGAIPSLPHTRSYIKQEKLLFVTQTTVVAQELVLVPWHHVTEFSYA